ncbi:hypothetical protein [Streptomyces sp. NPDC047869]|uniref:hypothetical protein n=1 Tax=Streptomyces sp. NPDC047869 TaxID=3154709 RepID=UPI0034546716
MPAGTVIDDSRRRFLIRDHFIPAARAGVPTRSFGFRPSAAAAQPAPGRHRQSGARARESEGNPAEEFQSALENGRTERQLSDSDLVNWRPEKKTRGRKKKSE